VTCDRCKELVQTIEIRTPGDLEMVLRVVKANLGDRTLEQQPPVPGNVMPSVVVESLAEAGPWPDVLEEKFRCPSCGQAFRLAAETFHGAGGRWSPE